MGELIDPKSGLQRVAANGQRWLIDQERRQKALDRQIAIACGEDDDATPKDQVAAFRAVLAAEAQNQNDEQHGDNRMDAGRNRILELLERGRSGQGPLVIESGGAVVVGGGDRSGSSGIADCKDKGGKPREAAGVKRRGKSKADGGRVDGGDTGSGQVRQKKKKAT